MRPHTGKLLWVDTDAKIITLPAVATGLDGVMIVNGGAFGTVAVNDQPNAADMIFGPDITAADNKDLINTKATARRGDFTVIGGNDADGYAALARWRHLGPRGLNLQLVICGFARSKGAPVVVAGTRDPFQAGATVAPIINQRKSKMLASQYEKITTRSVIGMIAAGLDTGVAAWVTCAAMKSDSDQASEDYGWLGNAPAMREFIDGRSPAELRENSFRINNKDYEGSIKVKPKDLRRDKTGPVAGAHQPAHQPRQRPSGQAAFDADPQRRSTNCYDGQYFFDTDHSRATAARSRTRSPMTRCRRPHPDVRRVRRGDLEGHRQMLGFKSTIAASRSISRRRVRWSWCRPPLHAGVALKAVTALLGSGGATATIPALKADVRGQRRGQPAPDLDHQVRRVPHRRR
jgi:hypothetical protein